MSTPRKARHGRSKSEYLETAKLEVLVPHQEGLDIIAAMKAAHQGGDNLGLGKGAAEMFGIRQRKFLFYGMLRVWYFFARGFVICEKADFADQGALLGVDYRRDAYDLCRP